MQPEAELAAHAFSNISKLVFVGYPRELLFVSSQSIAASLAVFALVSAEAVDSSGHLDQDVINREGYHE